jgi:hypothetical protein
MAVSAVFTPVNKKWKSSSNMGKFSLFFIFRIFFIFFFIYVFRHLLRLPNTVPLSPHMQSLYMPLPQSGEKSATPPPPPQKPPFIHQLLVALIFTSLQDSQLADWAHHSNTNGGSETVDYQFPGRHNGLYLYFGRILGPVWFMPLARDVSKPHQPLLDSVVTSEELLTVLGQLNALKGFVHANIYQNGSNSYQSSEKGRLQVKNLPF